MEAAAHITNLERPHPAARPPGTRREPAGGLLVFETGAGFGFRLFRGQASRILAGCHRGGPGARGFPREGGRGWKWAWGFPDPPQWPSCPQAEQSWLPRVEISSHNFQDTLLTC